MSQINYKQKYEEIKAKYMQDVDTSFRLGFEQGFVQAQQESMVQQQQMQQEQAQNQQKVGQGYGAEGSPAGEEQMQNPNGGSVEQLELESENPAGSELDQHIQKLESMIAKSETSKEDLAQAVNHIQFLRRSMSVQAGLSRDLKKSARAISGITKALHKPAFKFSQTASANMNDSAKKAVTIQEKIVTDVMQSWSEEEQKASQSISNILSVQGLIQKD
jgi:hypothetical protein